MRYSYALGRMGLRPSVCACGDLHCLLGRYPGLLKNAPRPAFIPGRRRRPVYEALARMRVKPSAHLARCDGAGMKLRGVITLADILATGSASWGSVPEGFSTKAQLADKPHAYMIVGDTARPVLIHSPSSARQPV